MLCRLTHDRTLPHHDPGHLDLSTCATVNHMIVSSAQASLNGGWWSDTAPRLRMLKSVTQHCMLSTMLLRKVEQIFRKVEQIFKLVRSNLDSSIAPAMCVRFCSTHSLSVALTRSEQWLITSIFGLVWELVNCALSLLSVLFYIIQVTSTTPLQEQSIGC